MDKNKKEEINYTDYYEEIRNLKKEIEKKEGKADEQVATLQSQSGKKPSR